MCLWHHSLNPFPSSQAFMLEKELCMCALFVILFLLHACTVLFLFYLTVFYFWNSAHWSHPDLVVILNRQYRLWLTSPVLHFTWLLFFSKLLDSLITIFWFSFCLLLLGILFFWPLHKCWFSSGFCSQVMSFLHPSFWVIWFVPMGHHCDLLISKPVHLFARWLLHLEIPYAREIQSFRLSSSSLSLFLCTVGATSLPAAGASDLGVISHSSFSPRVKSVVRLLNDVFYWYSPVHALLCLAGLLSSRWHAVVTVSCWSSLSGLVPFLILFHSAVHVIFFRHSQSLQWLLLLCGINQHFHMTGPVLLDLVPTFWNWLLSLLGTWYTIVSNKLDVDLLLSGAYALVEE